MDNWIKNLWNNNKILFFVLLPLVLIVFFRDLIMELLIGSVRKEVRETKDKDAKLKAEQDAANKEAERLKAEADKIDKDIENGKDPDKDWHKKL